MSVLGSRSETSFKKQCHKGLTGVDEPEEVELEKSPLSEIHTLRAWQIGMC